jgi:hypothetical protein
METLARLILDFCMARRRIEQAEGKEMMEICARYYGVMNVDDFVMLN